MLSYIHTTVYLIVAIPLSTAQFSTYLPATQAPSAYFISAPLEFYDRIRRSYGVSEQSIHAAPVGKFERKVGAYGSEEIALSLGGAPIGLYRRTKGPYGNSEEYGVSLGDAPVSIYEKIKGFYDESDKYRAHLSKAPVGFHGMRKGSYNDLEEYGAFLNKAPVGIYGRKRGPYGELNKYAVSLNETPVGIYRNTKGSYDELPEYDISLNKYPVSIYGNRKRYDESEKYGLFLSEVPVGTYVNPRRSHGQFNKYRIPLRAGIYGNEREYFGNGYTMPLNNDPDSINRNMIRLVQYLRPYLSHFVPLHLHCFAFSYPLNFFEYDSFYSSPAIHLQFRYVSIYDSVTGDPEPRLGGPR